MCAAVSCRAEFNADEKADAEMMLKAAVQDAVTSSPSAALMRADSSGTSIIGRPTSSKPRLITWKEMSRDDPGEIKRRPPFEVELKRFGENWRTLGLLLDPDDNPIAATVRECWSPSLIDDWNKLRPEEEKVRPGDIIESVNDVPGSTDGIITAIQLLGKGSTVKLRIR